MTSHTTMTTFNPRVYITRQIPQRGLDLLLSRCNVSFWDSAEPAPKTELLMSVCGVDVLLCMPSDTIDVDVLNAAGPSLKILATMSEDSNHIDVDECTRRNIRLITMATVDTETVADLAVGLLLSITRKWIHKDQGNVNQWLQGQNIKESVKKSRDYRVELSNRTLGIIGLGPLGMSIGKTFRELGVSEILYSDKSAIVCAADIDADFVPRNELFQKSDIVCLCSNSNSDGTSAPILNKAAFELMKKTAIVIDASKGKCADFTDLYEALRNGEIEAAGLDVREYDVIPHRHPLAVLENCFFLPYRECYKWDGRCRLSEDLARSILENLKA